MNMVNYQQNWGKNRWATNKWASDFLQGLFDSAAEMKNNISGNSDDLLKYARKALKALIKQVEDMENKDQRLLELINNSYGQITGKEDVLDALNSVEKENLLRTCPFFKGYSGTDSEKSYPKFIVLKDTIKKGSYQIILKTKKNLYGYTVGYEKIAEDALFYTFQKGDETPQKVDVPNDPSIQTYENMDGHVIYIDETVIEILKHAYTRESILKKDAWYLFESTIFHEILHWRISDDIEHNTTNRPNEVGENFETLAYFKDLGYQDFSEDFRKKFCELSNISFVELSKNQIKTNYSEKIQYAIPKDI